MSRGPKVRNPIITDPVDEKQFYELHYAVSCEDCTHFNHSEESCTFGFPTEPFRRKRQEEDLKTTGHLAFCRAIEID